MQNETNNTVSAGTQAQADGSGWSVVAQLFAGLETGIEQYRAVQHELRRLGDRRTGNAKLKVSCSQRHEGNRENGHRQDEDEGTHHGHRGTARPHPYLIALAHRLAFELR